MTDATDPLADLSTEERKQLAKLAKTRANGGVSRREALGVLGGGALASLSGASLLSSSNAGKASAQPSQSNGVPNLGGPNDRIDAWFAGIDAESANIDALNIKSKLAQFGLGGHVVPISPGVGVSDAVPVSNATPINDAIDVINTDGNGSGMVMLPPGFFENDAPMIRSSDDPEDIAFIGHGTEATQVQITDNTANGIELLSGDGTNAGSGIVINGIQLRGNGSNRTDGSAIKITSNPQRVHIGPRGLELARWDNTNAPVADIDGKMFQCNWWDLKLFNYDGDGVNVDTIGTNNWFGEITVKAPGGNVPVRINRPGGELTIEQLNVSNNADRVGNIRQSQAAPLSIHTIHFEGSQPSGTQDNLIFFGETDGQITINNVKVQTGDFNYIYDNQAGSAVGGRLELCKPLGNAAINQTLRLRGDLTEPAVFDGKANQINNDSGATWTEQMWCRGDLVAKQSTGVGFDGGTNDRKV